MTNEELIQEAGTKAGGYFKSGYNCAEAIFLTFREYLAPEIDPQMVKLITGFGEGLGRAGCMCGALSGSVMALDMLKGRTDNQTSQLITAQYSKEFHDRFREKFGGTCCRVLNKFPFETRERAINCIKITANTAKLLMEYLLETGLYAVPAQVC